MSERSSKSSSLSKKPMKYSYDRFRAQFGASGFFISVLGVFAIALVTVLSKWFDPIFIGIITFFFFVLSIFVILLVLTYKERQTGFEATSLSEIENGPWFRRSGLAAIICSADGTVIGANGPFFTICGYSRKEVIGNTLRNITGIRLLPEALLDAEKRPDGFIADVSDRKYLVKGYSVSTKDFRHKKTSVQENSEASEKQSGQDGSRLYVLIWQDVTHFENLENELDNESVMIANIAIDNIDDLVQTEGADYLDIKTDVEAKLNAWADSYDGVLNEYQRNRYLFFFQKKHLDAMVGKKFDILDTVREKAVGAYSTPVTVSIGISDSTGTILEKKSGSAARLETAGQRGGDQVVLKYKDEICFFGGNTKSIQKLSNTRAGVMAKKLSEIIKASSNVLVMGHMNADYDCFGSCIAAAMISLELGVPTNIILRDTNPNIEKCIAIAKSQPKYKNIFINGNTALDRISSGTLLVIVDVNNPSQFEYREVYDNCPKVAIIDHHRPSEKQATGKIPLMNLIDSSVSSSCEIFTEMLSKIIVPDEKILRYESDLIYSGILVDSKNFTFNSGARTFNAAGLLRKWGADPMRVNETLFASSPEEFEMVAGFHNNMKLYPLADKIIAIAVNKRDDLTISEDKYAAIAADRMLTLDRVVASFTVCVIDGIAKIKGRSTGTKDSISVGLVLEKLGGGGHFQQAAAAVPGIDADEAMSRLAEAIEEVVNDRQ